MRCALVAQAFRPLEIEDASLISDALFGISEFDVKVLLYRVSHAFMLSVIIKTRKVRFLRLYPTFLR